jgi:predicted glycoside hydrolase/deacetylase ChbG (UPF0249 family)
VAQEYGILRIRFPVERELELEPSPDPPLAPRGSWSATLKLHLIRTLCRRERPRLEAAGVRTTDHFVGIRYQHCLNSTVLRLILDHLDSGVTELMCHPGFEDEQLGEYSSVPPHRQRELEGLVDPQVADLVRGRSIRRMHFGEL